MSTVVKKRADELNARDIGASVSIVTKEGVAVCDILMGLYVSADTTGDDDLCIALTGVCVRFKHVVPLDDVYFSLAHDSGVAVRHEEEA